MAEKSKPIEFKKTIHLLAGLDTALKKEKEKYKKCSVTEDLVSEYVTLQGWGYVVIG